MCVCVCIHTHLNENKPTAFDMQQCVVVDTSVSVHREAPLDIYMGVERGHMKDHTD